MKSHYQEQASKGEGAGLPKTFGIPRRSRLRSKGSNGRKIMSAWYRKHEYNPVCKTTTNSLHDNKPCGGCIGELYKRFRQARALPFAGFCVLLILCGCSRTSGKLLIMEANLQNAQGMYSQAISSYTKALEYTDAAPYAEFGLGTVYFTLGEEKAALERLADAGNMLEAYGPNAGRELRYRILYNTGVVLFSEGDFSGAVDSFRNALKIDGGKKEAKRNLELSIRSLERENKPGSGEGEGESESRAAMFEYIRQKEFNQWRSMEWQKEDDIDGLDY